MRLKVVVKKIHSLSNYYLVELSKDRNLKRFQYVQEVGYHLLLW